MKKIYFLICIFALIVPGAYSQTDQAAAGHPVLSPDEQMVLSSIPLLELPEKYKGPDAPLLPSSIDNSTQPYFRPITSQVGLECGQSGGIAFNFTYEVDRLRNLPANTGANQYPTHFAWDFLNGGSNMGVCCFDSWEIVRACGTMNVADYGGLNYGGYLRWINGYDKYYNGMGNRLNYMRAIDCSTPEGLQTLKYWLYDHLEGSAVGGVGNFYGNYFSPTQVLPAGTPEAGKAVVTNWGSSPSHTWTACGYNDSIRYDFNGDGLYTNNVDINNDGVVDMHDWEIGGVKFANGYAGTGWGNGGFCYLMYKNLADNIGFGGIWNHRIYVIDVKPSCSPKLTMKIVLKHTSRNKLKVTTGVSTNLSATAPDFVQEYPIFRYQGGDFYMQGGSTEADKTIEFGLDLTGLLNNIAPNQPAKFFLQVQENDPSGVATGEIVSWSIIDYTTGTPLTTNYPTNNTPISNNTLTRLSLNYTINFVRPDITNTALPAANLYQPYSCQLNATSGTTPYLWDLKLDYPETSGTSAFPMINNQPLTPTNNNSGYALKTLPFTIPFYNRQINTLYIYVDGYILFDNQPYTWPYIIDKNLLFKETAIISPFMTDQILYSAQSDGIWYQEDASSVTIRWKTSIYNMQGTSGLNYAIKLYKDGRIEYYYGNMNYPATTSWTGGLSSGDNKNYQYTTLNGASSITSNTKEAFAACGFPAEMTLSEDGLFSGTPENVYTNRQINFRVTDLNNLSNTKILTFSTNGLLLDYSISSGNDSIIEYGENTLVTLKITNVGNQTVHNVNTWITETDQYIVMTDSTAFAGDLAPGQVMTITNAFAFNVSSLVPDNHTFPLVFHVSSTEHNFTKQVMLTAFAPEIVSGEITIIDGDNGRLDPGETATLKVLYRNNGGAKANNLNVVLTSNDPLLSISTPTSSLGTLKPDSVSTASFVITASAQAPFEHLYRTGGQITANNGYLRNDSLFIFSGDVIEDFETGTMNKFNWYMGGFGTWWADGLEHYEGSYCTRSGWIYDNNESSLNLSVNILADGKISFMKKVSCENDPNGTNYDYIAFLIDGAELGRWDGIIDWSPESYNITKGFHTITFLYHKDYSVSANSDCGWIDFIVFPPFAGAWPQINVNPASFEKSLDVGTSANDNLKILNTGGGVMDFSAMVFDTATNKSVLAPESLSGSYIECFTDGFIPGQNFTWTFAVHNTGTDNEYVEEIKMDMPSGFDVTQVTNFSGGSLGELVFQGTTGAGTSLLWHGESSPGTGVIKPGETAMTIIQGNVDENYSDDGFIVYSIRGDSTGNLPHNPFGYIKLRNFSLPNTWLTLTNNFGTIIHGDTASVNVHFNAAGLPAPSDISCHIIVKDEYNNKITVPVLMHVLDTTVIIGTVSHEIQPSLMVYPNPFSGPVNIRYSLPWRTDVTAFVMDYTGKIIRHLISKEHDAGNYFLTWDGKNENGNDCNAGIYILKMTAGNSLLSKKLVRIR